MQKHDTFSGAHSECLKWLEEKRLQVGRPIVIDNFVQVFIGPQVATIVHSNY